jgi:hypothetical protein
MALNHPSKGSFMRSQASIVAALVASLALCSPIAFAKGGGKGKGAHTGGASKQTSKTVASKASKQLANPKSTPDQKSVAGSALSQTPNGPQRKQ